MKRLAIVGSHPDTCHLAPFDDHDTDIWLFNESAQNTAEFYPDRPDRQWAKRWDALFQKHLPEVYQSPTNWVINSHWEWLQRDHGDRVIWMNEVDALVPNSKKYPLEEIIATVPGASREWFASTPAYAIALALYLGYKDIGFYGFDLRSNTEYNYQFPNYVYWVGVCEGMGINLYYISNAQYLTGKLYGYEGELQLSKEYFEERRDKAHAEWEAIRNKSDKLRSRFMDAVQACKYDKIPPIIIQWRDVAIKAGAMSAAEQEATQYAARKDAISRQEFERRAATASQQGEEQKALMYVKGGQAEYVFNAWRQTGAYQPLQQLRKLMDEQMQMAYNAGASLGVYKENLEYCGEYDDRLQAAGGPRTLAAVKEGKNGSN